MARLTMWQLGLGEALFEADLGDREEELDSLWCMLSIFKIIQDLIE
jgi:hypothetical protein